MLMTPWRPIRDFDRARFAAARLQAHHATQWLARAARAYVPARPDDGHTSLGWDDGFGGLMSHPLPDGTRLGLRIADLTLALCEPDMRAPRDVFPLGGRCDPDACAWLMGHAGMRDLDPRALEAPLPYMLPERATGGTYTVDPRQLDELAAWFSNADTALGAVRERIVAQGLAAPPVRCWPHHFDLDTLVTVAPGRTSGVGFAPGDDFYDEPYFYVSVYPAPDVASLPALPPIGHWHAQDFTAAVATAQRILQASDPGGAVAAFLHAATAATIAALRRE
jgi:Family of unknown function (DUF5996)